MDYNYDIKLDFTNDNSFDVEYINNVCRKYPNKKILVEILNTKGITSSKIREINSNVSFRIVGGYTKERISKQEPKTFNNGETTDYYVTAVIYNRNEVISILEEIEKIESGIDEKWSDLQKVIYVYDKLKKEIIYDPEFEKQSSNEVRSLRGLVSKMSVCAGYSLIFKELMDRQGILCEYVEGYVYKKYGHAWNIVSINGKKYPLDLTWESRCYRNGKNTYNYLGQNVNEFSKKHNPFWYETTQNYKKNLSHLNSELVKSIAINLQNEEKYFNRMYKGKRYDGTKYIVSQTDEIIFKGKKYYQYIYTELKDNLPNTLIPLYSNTNISRYVDRKQFKRNIPEKFFYTISNVLFSKENIMDSLNNKTYYIGDIRKNSKNNKFELVSDISEIVKPKELKNNFNYSTKLFQRSDKTFFIVHESSKELVNINGAKLFQFDVFEIIVEDNDYVLKRNTIFTEKNLLKDNRQDIADVFLSRSRIDRKAKETNGYIGYYSEDGFKMSNVSLIGYFKSLQKDNLIKNRKSK